MIPRITAGWHAIQTVGLVIIIIIIIIAIIIVLVAAAAAAAVVVVKLFFMDNFQIYTTWVALKKPQCQLTAPVISHLCLQKSWKSHPLSTAGQSLINWF